MTFTNRFARLASITLIASCAIALPSTSALAVTVPVDPGVAISAGKTIIGAGQNLPSLDSTGSWNIGSYPAPQVNAYYASGHAAADQAEVAASALQWTKSWVSKTCGSLKPAKVRACKAAAVFDIDETLLSNYEWISTLPVPFTYDVDASNSANQNCTTPPIAASVALFNSFKRLGVTPFIVTGRGESQRAMTEACLAKSGIAGYGALVLKPAGNTRLLPTARLTSARP